MLQSKIDDLLGNIGINLFCLALQRLGKSTMQRLGLAGLDSDDADLFISTVCVRGRMNEFPRQYNAVRTNNRNSRQGIDPDIYSAHLNRSCHSEVAERFQGPLRGFFKKMLTNNPALYLCIQNPISVETRLYTVYSLALVILWNTRPNFPWFGIILGFLFKAFC